MLFHPLDFLFTPILKKGMQHFMDDCRYDISFYPVLDYLIREINEMFGSLYSVTSFLNLFTAVTAMI